TWSMLSVLLVWDSTLDDAKNTTIRVPAHHPESPTRRVPRAIAATVPSTLSDRRLRAVPATASAARNPSGQCNSSGDMEPDSFLPTRTARSFIGWYASAENSSCHAVAGKSPGAVRLTPHRMCTTL